MSTVDHLLQLLEVQGHSQYGGEPVTQLEHALQSALLAERDGASPALVAAALLHDVGHLLHTLPDDAPAAGIDDHHESSARNYLRRLFPDEVTEPISLHVAAKRYLCATEAEYRGALSRPSLVSLELQGGPMTREEADAFERHPFAQDAVRLRRWDDAAKAPGSATPPLSHFAAYLRQAARTETPA
jgi:[1-hydroxy-2-(trimethylamino)ethyl]phosphonate dioxygenase